MMNKNTAKINAGIRALTHKPFEIISGKVVSVDAGAGTMTVRPSDDGEPIEGVRLIAITGSTDGLILYPDTDSDVIIGSIDGPGEWALLCASKITKASIKIASVNYEMTDDKVTIQNSNVALEVTNTVFKMKTASESLFDILKDLLTHISMLTVPTPSGPSSVPTNVADFTALITRLSNLLAH